MTSFKDVTTTDAEWHRRRALSALLDAVAARRRGDDGLARVLLDVARSNLERSRRF